MFFIKKLKEKSKQASRHFAASILFEKEFFF